MKQIRHNIFETNSSSTHSVSLTNMSSDIPNFEQLDSYVDPADHYIHIGFGEFGWGYNEYVDAYTKLQYLLTMILETNKCDFGKPIGIKSIEEFYLCDDFILLESIITEHVKDCKGINIIDPDIKLNVCEIEGTDEVIQYVTHNGYIDHQSCENYNCLADFLNDFETTIEDFVFNENVMLLIDSDNN